MKISEKWLREWVSPKLDTQALAHRLTMAGLEVGAVEPVAPKLDKVVVGKIVSIAPHPSADKLRLCRVDIGKGNALDIVCGAVNAAVGMRAPVALEGATLPNGMTIKRTEIRGVASSGMLCSAQELGLAESAEGLLALGADAKPGTSITEYLGLDDSALEVELTPNRGDCLSVAGLARELTAITGVKMKSPAIKPVKPKHRLRIPVKLEAQQDCPHYIGRVVTGINAQAITPMWIKEKLRRSGIRSIHPVVDVTNYVMLELGQPMHAFDFSKIHGAIHVRHAAKDESLVLLDGNRLTPRPGSLLIADDVQPLALAGIMGGMDSAVSDSTRDLFLESAWFRPGTISVRAREHGLQTDSSYRFERGVDPALQRLAMERATALILDIVGGKPGPVIEQTVKRHLPRVSPVSLRLERVKRLLGLDMPAKDAEIILQRLGMKPKKAGNKWTVTPPSYRFDISREVDLIEEIARIHGYDRLPSRRPRLDMAASPVPESDIGESRLRAGLIDRDYQEAVTYSFVEPGIQALIDPQLSPARLANPISADMAVMRTSLWPGLLQTILYNQNRQQTRIRFFELGRIFLPQGEGFHEEPVLAGAVCGEALTEQWGLPRRAVDFHDMKADVEALLVLAGIGSFVRFQPGQHPALHPGQTAEIHREGDGRIGLLGVLHPGAQSRLGLDRPVVLFELKLAALRNGKIPIFHEFSRFPSIRRDLAILVDDSTSAQAVLDCVQKAAGTLLVNLELFDEYRGKGIDSGRKSLALGLTLQDSSRTLNEDDVERVMTQVMTALQTGLGARPRQ
ncbi:phenylalanyl-tRNA synthetase subunit beta [Sulfuricaulis limicola]|uniref:Phenylalanine--tRNA ligase beta subunit n=1 Tax=Sulfuricaulis limicola TaxID=1620215 RepID=A0A1B4XG95_9GAMM|nr:phenylalanine--tRNA ligase subunit beta [Sulfuricaulis limicola]BAV33805.1 phenylalanyl-tRNA synthetase subunit beta [Sulfuricaulis limicola]